jgi:hypothetical protein
MAVTRYSLPSGYYFAPFSASWKLIWQKRDVWQEDEDAELARWLNS